MSDGPIPLRDAIRMKLESTLGPVFFSDFRLMLSRDSVFVVAKTVSILECAVAVAMDDHDVVSAWIDAGALRKPSQSERDTWPGQESRQWTSLVVQPFVLVQDPE